MSEIKFDSGSYRPKQLLHRVMEAEYDEVCVFCFKKDGRMEYHTSSDNVNIFSSIYFCVLNLVMYKVSASITPIKR